MELEKIFDELKSTWIDAVDINDYFIRAYAYLFNFCFEKYVLNETEFTVHKRYKNVKFDPTINIIENEDYRYIFILLCALKSSDILELLNFIMLPTDHFSYTEKSILREIEITKGLITIE